MQFFSTALASKTAPLMSPSRNSTNASVIIYNTLYSRSGESPPKTRRGGHGSWRHVASLLCVAGVCLRFALFVKQRHFFSSFSRGSSCRKRVDLQKPSWYSFTVKYLQVRLMWTAAEIASTHHNNLLYKNTNCLVECRKLDDRRYSICVWRN